MSFIESSLIEGWARITRCEPYWVGDHSASHRRTTCDECPRARPSLAAFRTAHNESCNWSPAARTINSDQRPARVLVSRGAERVRATSIAMPRAARGISALPRVCLLSYMLIPTAGSRRRQRPRSLRGCKARWEWPALRLGRRVRAVPGHVSLHPSEQMLDAISAFNYAICARERAISRLSLTMTLLWLWRPCDHEGRVTLKVVWPWRSCDRRRQTRACARLARYGGS